MIVQLGSSVSAVTIKNDFGQDSTLLVDNDNLPPVTDFSFTKKQRMDIVLAIGSGTYSISTITDKINAIVTPALQGRDIEPNYIIVNSDNALDSILPTIHWQENSERYYVAICNSAFSELSDVSRVTNITGMLYKDDICFIGLGTPGNQAALIVILVFISLAVIFGFKIVSILFERISFVMVDVKPKLKYRSTAALLER
jgi:hypothetical protein